MSMTRLLGTGAGDFYDLHGVSCSQPNCSRARELGGRNLRQASAALVSPDILVDFHDAKQLSTWGVPPESIRHVLITHTHFDHFQPVALLELSRRSREPLRVYGNHAVADSLSFAAGHRWDATQGNFVAASDTSRILVTTVQTAESFWINDLRVTPVQANHMIDKENTILEGMALNYVFERGGRTLFYAVDTSYVLPRTLDILSKFRFDVLVIDATFGDLEIDPFGSGHHNFAMLERTLGEFRTRGLLSKDAMVVADHISMCSVAPHDEIVDRLAAKGITLAYDGMVLPF